MKGERSTPVNIEIVQEVQPENRSLIARRLQEFNAPYLGEHPFGVLDIYARDAEGQLVGGLLAEYAFGWLYINVLWISENFRGMGIGATMLTAVEQTAIEKGCHSASLDTMSFQALAFYEKRGYVRFGVLDNYPGGGSSRFYEKCAYVRVGVLEGYPGGAQKIFMQKHLKS